MIAAWLALVALFGVLGALERIEGVPLGLFDLDGEGKPPAAFSGALLLCTGALSHLIGRTTRDDGRRGLVWNGMAAFFAYMAIDEMLTIHEHLEEWSGIGWTNLYLPLAAAGGVGWLLVLRRIWSLGRRLFEWGPRAFALGPAPWLVAIVLEKVQGGSRGRVDGYTAMATAEELLEMLGDGLFMVGLLFALRALAGYDSSSRTKA